MLFSAIFICLVSTGIGGCGWKKTGVEKLRDLDYTVVGEAELPEELKTEIEARKAEDFKMTYLLDDALYIVHGFRNAGDRRLQHTGAGIVSGRKCNLF